jgi:hypothetical protein
LVSFLLTSDAERVYPLFRRAAITPSGGRLGLIRDRSLLLAEADEEEAIQVS